MMTMVDQKRGTIVPTCDGDFLQTWFDGRTSRRTMGYAEFWANGYTRDHEQSISNIKKKLDRDIKRLTEGATRDIEAHTKAIEVNQATLKHIEAQRLARAEAERLKLSPEQERLWGLVDKWKNHVDPPSEYTISIGTGQKAVYWFGGKVNECAYPFHSPRQYTSGCFYDFLISADASEFPAAIRKPLLDKLCEVHQKTPGQLADWIEEQRRPKPKFEVLSTDRFLGYETDPSLWLVRGEQETWVVHRCWKTNKVVPTSMQTWARTFKGGANWLTFHEGIRRMREAGWDVQVKQVEPPAPPKPTWPNVTMGDKVKHVRRGVFIVSVFDVNKIGLTSIETGCRWTAPIDLTFGEHVSLEKLTGCFGQAEDWTKL